MPLSEPLQNPGLIQGLFERYYRQRVRSADMSSHWRQYSGEFSVEIDAAGHVERLTGFGFGELRSNGAGHRWVQALSIAANLARLPQRRELWRLRPLFLDVCRRMTVDPTLDAFRQLCTVELLARSIPAHLAHRPLRFLMIGDGFGLSAALVKAFWPNAQLVMIDLGQTLLFQAVYLQRAYPAPSTHALAGTDGSRTADFVYCASDQREGLADRQFDVAVNVASMQEMDPPTVASYFDFLRRHLRPENLFYCCNRERKQLPDGQMSAIAEYPWVPGDRVWLDEPCPWHQFYLTIRSAARPPRALGVPVPGISYYDGTHRHRLVSMQIS